MGRPPWHLRGVPETAAPERPVDPAVGAHHFLVLEDDPARASRFSLLLAPLGTVVIANSVPEGLDALGSGRIDAAVCGHPFDGTIGLELLDDLYAASPGLPVVLCTDDEGEVRADPRAGRPVATLPRREGSPREFLEAVTGAVRRSDASRSVAVARQHAHILAGVSEGVVIVATTGRIISMSDRAVELFGLGEVEPPVSSVWDLPGSTITADGPPERRREHPVARAFAQGVATTATREITRPDDHARRWIEFAVEPLVIEGELAPYAAIVTIRDITDRRVAQRVRHAVERRELALSAQAADGYLILDHDGRIADASPTILRGRRSEPVMGSRAIALLDPASRVRFTEAFFECRDRPTGPVRVRVTVVEEDEGDRTVDATLTNWIAESSVAGIVVNFRDVTELALLEQARRNGDGRFELTFEHASIGMAVVDLSLRVIRANAALLKLLGLRTEDVLGAEVLGVVHPDEREVHGTELEAIAQGAVREYHAARRLIGADGHVVWVNIDGVLVRDAAGDPLHLILQIQDTTERRRSEDALAHQSLHDALTGLPNRSLLYDRLNRAIDQAFATSGGVAVVYVDIDRFQVVNDSLGHAAGDDLLMQVAGRLASGLGRTDTVARFGADEFVIVREHCDGAAAAALGEDVVRRFDHPFRIGEEEVRVTASAGVVLANEFGSVGDALRDADAAVNRAKNRGGDRAELFDAELRRQAAHRFGLEQTLSRAIDRHELRVVYQPILDMATRDLVGFEALLRWASPMWGELPPQEIIEIAEATGQIARIGEFVLSEALDQITEARRTAGEGSTLWVSVNLSSREFAITDPVARCAGMLEAKGVPADAVRFELTETAVMEDIEGSIAQLNRLRDLGVKVALDDFGTGHSSLAHLSRLPVSVLKIDHSFVWSLSGDVRDVAIIEAIVTMGKALGLELCAEGIETERQLALLAQLGCDDGQGFLFSTPLEPDELLAYIAAGIALDADIPSRRRPA